MGSCDGMQRFGARWGRLLPAVLLLLTTGFAHAQNIFDQTSPSPGPFTSKFFGEIKSSLANPCLVTPYIYSTGVSSSGIVSGGMGAACEYPVNLDVQETPIVWGPNFGAGG